MTHLGSLERVAGVTHFQVSQEDSYLQASFRLVNAENKPIAAKGNAFISLYDGEGNLIYSEGFALSQEIFSEHSKEYSWTIPKEKLNWVISREDFIAKAVIHGSAAMTQGRAVLKIITNNGETTLTAEYHGKFYSREEAERIIREIYYKQAAQKLESALNEQWPFKVGVSDYVMIGDYGWAVIRRTGGEIIIFPFGRIYNWYLIQSKDGGRSWDIVWRDDRPPLFEVEFLSEKEVRVTTPNAIFYTRDEGKTWNVQPGRE